MIIEYILEKHLQILKSNCWRISPIVTSFVDIRKNVQAPPSKRLFQSFSDSDLSEQPFGVFFISYFTLPKL